MWAQADFWVLIQLNLGSAAPFDAVDSKYGLAKPLRSIQRQTSSAITPTATQVSRFPLHLSIRLILSRSSVRAYSYEIETRIGNGENGGFTLRAKSLEMNIDVSCEPPMSL
jgi:hypothetical protein